MDIFGFNINLYSPEVFYSVCGSITVFSLLMYLWIGARQRRKHMKDIELVSLGVPLDVKLFKADGGGTYQQISTNKGTYTFEGIRQFGNHNEILALEDGDGEITLLDLPKNEKRRNRILRKYM